jgi:hypothetical protein
LRKSILNLGSKLTDHSIYQFISCGILQKYAWKVPFDFTLQGAFYFISGSILSNK